MLYVIQLQEKELSIIEYDEKYIDNKLTFIDKYCTGIKNIVGLTMSSFEDIYFKNNIKSIVYYEKEYDEFTDEYTFSAFSYEKAVKILEQIKMNLR
jgi:hypothetical protein